jgi:YHS domain-containing protein
MKTRIVIAACLFGSVVACQAQGTRVSGPVHAAPTTAATTQAAPVEGAGASDALALVTDRSLVCMVNNQFMGRPQIPVTVDSRVYYGCCEMCKGRLTNDAGARSATDPISGRAIDKAVAVIGRTETGSTLYFENQANFAAYAKRPRVQ